MRDARLSALELDSFLPTVPSWTLVDREIARTFDCGSFRAAIAFVVQIGYLAEATDHHPDIDVRYRRVRIALTTHDSDGLTERDFALARALDEVFVANYQQ